MGKRLLVRYIQEMVEAHLARVPNQLLSPAEEGNGQRDEDEVHEGIGVGAATGFTAPLGMDPDGLGRKKNKPKRKS